jgi:hypothetical protein
MEAGCKLYILISIVCYIFQKSVFYITREGPQIRSHTFGLWVLDPRIRTHMELEYKLAYFL